MKRNLRMMWYLMYIGINDDMVLEMYPNLALW